MENIVQFGTIELPSDKTSSVTYTAPSNLPAEMLKKVFWGDRSENSISAPSQVTHNVFFGENLKRIKKTLFENK